MVINLDFQNVIIDCQSPPDRKNINRKFSVIKCIFDNIGQNKIDLYNVAKNLADKVNPKQANQSVNTRNANTLIIDAAAGILAEHGWLQFINQTFGNIASFTDFISSNNQIDIVLKNGETIEIRSSFARNGLKFALCNDKYNFKNVGKYSNLYKPNETPKGFYAAVIFEINKDDLFRCDKIQFYLIGGSTKEMFRDNKIAYTDNLQADGDLNQIKTDYRVIKLKNALDIDGFKIFMQNIGYLAVKNQY